MISDPWILGSIMKNQPPPGSSWGYHPWTSDTLTMNPYESNLQPAPLIPINCWLHRLQVMADASKYLTPVTQQQS